MNDARPGANTSGAPQSSVSENGPGPEERGMTAPSATSGSGRPSSSIDERRSRQQADAIHAVSQDFASQREHTLRRFALDADTQVGAGQHGCRPAPSKEPPPAGASEIDQPVVFGERERHGSRGLIGKRGRGAGCCAVIIRIAASVSLGRHGIPLRFEGLGALALGSPLGH